MIPQQLATSDGMLLPATCLNLAILPSNLTIARLKPSAERFRLYPLWQPQMADFIIKVKRDMF
jgi:hypothetical protein